MGALPKALARRGHRVMVVAPRYRNYEEGWETGVRVQLGVGGATVEVRRISCVRGNFGNSHNPVQFVLHAAVREGLPKLRG